MRMDTHAHRAVSKVNIHHAVAFSLLPLLNPLHQQRSVGYTNVVAGRILHEQMHVYGIAAADGLSPSNVAHPVSPVNPVGPISPMAP